MSLGERPSSKHEAANEAVMERVYARYTAIVRALAGRGMLESRRVELASVAACRNRAERRAIERERNPRPDHLLPFARAKASEVRVGKSRARLNSEAFAAAVRAGAR